MTGKNKKQHETPDYWQPSSDLMTGLVLVLILVIMLLLLYLMRIPEFDDYNPFTSSEITESELDGDDVESYPEELEEQEEQQQQNAGGGGGGGGGDEPHNEPNEEPGEYPESEGTKSAVYVMLVDGETKKTVQEEGVQFDLRSNRGVLQILNTYYPVKVSYRDYETTERGTFYLPEKIPLGQYFLRNITQATGYDLAEDTEFEVDQLYDWPDPLVVTVPVFPARNVIRIRMIDAKSKQAVAGSSFDIIADENIMTKDGTVRYNSGEIVGTIVCGEDGVGESEELYLGKYRLKQTAIPEYYAGLMQTTSVTVGKKEEENDPELIKTEKTEINVRLKDELTENPISGAQFTIFDGEAEGYYTTDENGNIELENIKKNTTYTIRQTSTSEDYLLPESARTVKVSATGRVANSANTTVEIANRMIRVNINAEDAVLKGQLADMNLALYDTADTLIKSWTTTGVPAAFTNLKPGEYYLTVNDGSKRYIIQVADTKEIQNTNIRVWTMKSYLAIGAGIIVGILVIFVLIKILKTILKKKRKT